MGRPVGIAFAADGSMYLSDDAGGVIYRITYGK
jgi:glucose/arabinose dehydrogenase